MTTPKKEKRSARKSVTHADLADPLATPPSPEQLYQSFVGLVAAHARASADLDAIQSDADKILHETLENLRLPFGEKQSQVAALAAEIEDQARAHPEWFPAGTRTLKTPFGTAKLTAATRLAIATSETAVILAVEAMHESADLPNPYLRLRAELNLDALAGLPDDVLARLGLARVREDKFTLKPARVELGKAAANPVQAGGKGGAK